MSASGKSTGKGGMPSPGSGKGGGETNPTPGMPINYNVANDVYGQGLQVNQPMQGYYNQFPAGGSNYAPPVYPDPPPKAPNPTLPGVPPNFDYNNPFGNGGGYNPYAGGGHSSPFGSTSPYGFYNNLPNQSQYQPPNQTVRPGQTAQPIQTERPGQGQGSPFDQLLKGVTNQAAPVWPAPGSRHPETGETQEEISARWKAETAAGEAPAASTAPEGSGAIAQPNGRFTYDHPVHGRLTDLTQGGLDSMLADTGQTAPQSASAPAQLVDPRASASGNGRYSFNHPVHGQMDDLTEAGLASMIEDAGPVANPMDGFDFNIRY